MLMKVMIAFAVLAAILCTFYTVSVVSGMIMNKSKTRLERTDCRNAGEFYEMSGSHCPLDRPCDRCEWEREERALQAEVARLRDALERIAGWYKEHPLSDIARASLESTSEADPMRSRVAGTGGGVTSIIASPTSLEKP